MPKRIPVFEHGTLAVDEAGMTPAQFDALVRYNERHNCTFFSVGHRRLHFNSFVGVIQVGSLTIEILPKADKSTGPNEENKWQNALLQMLRHAGLLDVESAPEADLNLRRSPLIDLYLESFVSEVERIRHAGLVKKYRLSEGNLHKLKGRILFPQHIRRNLLHRERIYTAHQTYDADNIYNCILKRALTVTENLAVSPTITARAAALGLAFENVSDARITADTFDRLRLDRNTQRYHRSLELARLIILNYSPDLQGGSNNVLAILFDMNKLFERFILVHLRRAQSEFKNGKLSITGQASERFWKSKTIRPDVVIDFHTLANAERIILDTKWKIPKDDQPSDDDLKQMYVYNLQFGARRSFLVYPRSDVKQKETFAAYEKSDSDSPNHRHSCGTHFVDLFDANLDLRKDIGKQLLEQIINTAEQVGAN